MENVSKNRKFRKRHQQTTGRGQRQKSAAPKRATRNDPATFLNYQFSPIFPSSFSCHKRVESEFISSVKNLCSLYRLPIPDQIYRPYPLNIVETYQQLSRRFSSKDLDLIIAQQPGCKAAIVTVQRHAVAHTLYYIPVRPLAGLFDHPEHRAMALLVACIFSYLYNIVRLPYITEGAYVYHTYEYIKESMEQQIEEDGEESAPMLEPMIKEIDDLLANAESLLPFISDPFSLRELKTRLVAYRRCQNPDQSLVDITKSVLEFARAYPKRSMYDSLVLEQEPSPDIFRIDAYVSFFWSDNIMTAADFNDTIDCDFQNTGCQQDPQSVQWFNSPQAKEIHHLDFEPRLFDLIGQLAIYLTNLDDEEKYH